MSHINLDKPRYDQSTYMGRAKHFLYLTNPLNAFASSADLDEAKKIVTEFRRSRRMPPGYDEDKLWATKYLYDSAYHPDTGEKMFVLGRMAAQAPMNTIITGCMITFYKTTAQTAFWQWVNQTFNALVNYTNRSGDAPMPTSQLVASYCAACGGALSTALYLNSKVKGMNPIYSRLVPFAAVCGANFINIPMMRSGEILNGTPVFTADGVRVGESKRAAKYGIGLVCFSRILMALPGMTVTPIITSIATQRGLFNSQPAMVVPFQLFLVGLCVTFATPLCCAIFDQRASISVESLDPGLKSVKNDGLIHIPAVTPIITNIATQRGLFCRRPAMVVPFQLFLVGLCVTFATPLCCAIFDQRASISVDSLDPELRESVKKNYPKIKEVYFNKGL